ncbi:MAG TPA: hypothetical protein VM187_06800 [Niastella sp.]|nr:hypothetical protein [Niastella sp.]
MKKNTTMPSPNAKTQKDRQIRPENKDNLDSRKKEEQNTKGDDITHNKKDHRNQKSGQKKDHQ